MHVQFVNRENGPERLVCEAEIVFSENGPLGGLKLVGFSLWRTTEGDLTRGVDSTPAPAKRLKAWIVEEYQKQNGAAA